MFLCVCTCFQKPLSCAIATLEASGARCIPTQMSPDAFEMRINLASFLALSSHFSSLFLFCVHLSLSADFGFPLACIFLSYCLPRMLILFFLALFLHLSLLSLFTVSLSITQFSRLNGSLLWVLLFPPSFLSVVAPDGACFSPPCCTMGKLALSRLPD